jgi:hypothetical protein
MTRETKVGLVVAGSFLSLVGIVLASKLRQGENANAETTQVVEAIGPRAAKLGKQADSKKGRSEKRNSSSPNNSGDEPKTEKGLPVSDDAVLQAEKTKHVKDMKGASGMPSPDKHAASGDSQLEVKAEEDLESPTSEKKGPGHKKPKNDGNLNLRLDASAEGSKTASRDKSDDGLAKSEDKDLKSILDGPGPAKPKKKSSAQAGLVDPVKDKDSLAPASAETGTAPPDSVRGTHDTSDSAGHRDRDKPKDPVASVDGEVKPASSDGSAPAGSRETRVGPPDSKSNNLGATESTRPSANGGSTERAATDSARPVAGSTGAPASQDNTGIKPVAGTTDSARLLKDFPLGSRPAVATPAIALPSASAGSSTAQVRDWDVITYHAAQGDTFATISKSQYKDEKYEQALLKYNRDNGGFDQSSAVLTPGKPVLIPDLSALESLYSDIIPGYKPVTPAATPATGTTGTEPRLQSSTDKTPMATTPVVQVSTKKNTQAGPSYQVRQDGETYFTIAQKTLAKTERWSEIYHLNGDQYDPKNPVPRGTLLRLPADARVERTDKP